ncbi:MAG TPA: methionine aminotransferase [Sediminibacterium sp.]|nr:methionine aminotransferase [Sediminibacterium sp.]
MPTEYLINSKLPQVGTTIFTVMSQLAMEYKAVNLGQGFPDFPMPEQLVELTTKAMQEGYNQYTHMNGYPLLRERLCEKFHSLYQSELNPDTQITITPGGTYALYTAFTTVLRPGDEVIVFEPAYDSYIPNIELNGATAVRIALQYPGYAIPWEEVRNKITGKTRMIVLNSPHNPTGSVLSESDIEALRSVLQDHSILVVSDEVYEHLIYDGKPHLSLLRYPDLLERSFVCFSFGKAYHCTGWKLGYCVSSPELMREFRKVHQFNCFSCDTPKQVAIAEYLQYPATYLGIADFYQSKRDYFRSLMQNTPFSCLPSHGSYFECYDYRDFSEESDKDLAIRLVKEYGIATIPVSAFYQDGTDNKVLRFCFAKQNSTLEKAAEKLARLGV